MFLPFAASFPTSICCFPSLLIFILFCEIFIAICKRFSLTQYGAAFYVTQMTVKYSTNADIQIAGRIFQARFNISVSSIRFIWSNMPPAC
ncbi:DUF6783 domain-containing protein [Blautia faecicola]|uniref:DUF6783 domain-containing protein n=1 Tax=Blautia faecicola TaxID=2509240 RepID=UPI0038B720F9